MLYNTAPSLSFSVDSILRTRRNSPFGACGIFKLPCQVPVKLWANSPLADPASATTQQISLFICPPLKDITHQGPERLTTSDNRRLRFPKACPEQSRREFADCFPVASFRSVAIISHDVIASY